MKDANSPKMRVTRSRANKINIEGGNLLPNEPKSPSKSKVSQVKKNSNVSPFDFKNSSTNASIKSPEVPTSEHQNNRALKQKKTRLSASPKSTQPCKKKRKISHVKMERDVERVHQSDNLSSKQISIPPSSTSVENNPEPARDNYTKYLPTTENLKNVASNMVPLPSGLHIPNPDIATMGSIFPPDSDYSSSVIAPILVMKATDFHWANLISEYPHVPHQPLLVSGAMFGRSSRCQIRVRDSALSGMVFHLYHYVQLEPPTNPTEGTNPIVNIVKNRYFVLETLTANNHVIVNRKPVVKGMRTILVNGDRIKIVGARMPYSFIFQTIIETNNNHVQPKIGSQEIPSLSTNEAPCTTATTTATAAAAVTVTTLADPSEPPKLRDLKRKRSEIDFVELPENENNSSSSKKIDSRGDGSSKHKLYTDIFSSMIMNPDDIGVTFDTLDYNIPQHLIQSLIAAVYPYLSCSKDVVEKLKGLGGLSNRILLQGVPGTDILQLLLVKCLAKTLGAGLLIIDTADDLRSILASSDRTQMHAIIPMLEAADDGDILNSVDLLKHSSGAIVDSDMAVEEDIDDVDYDEQDASVDERVNNVGLETDMDVAVAIESRPSEKKSFPGVIVEEEAASIDSKASAENTEDGILGSGDQALANKKNNIQVTYDQLTLYARVRYIGDAKGSNITKTNVGPMVGLKGDVIIRFNGNGSGLVGVRFDESFQGGCNLGDSALCEQNNGSFVHMSYLQLIKDDSSYESEEHMAISALIRAVKSYGIDQPSTTTTTTEEKIAGDECQPTGKPCILCIRDPKSLMMCNYERFDYFKEQFTNENNVQENSNLVIMGISTALTASNEAHSCCGCNKNHGEKKSVSIIDEILTKGFSAGVNNRLGSRLTPFLDSLGMGGAGGGAIGGGRGVDKIRGYDSKQMLQLFPKVFELHPPPKGDAKYNRWSANMLRDKNILRTQANIRVLRRVTHGNKGISLNLIDDYTEILSDVVYLSGGMEKIVGYSIGKYLENSQKNIITDNNNNNNNNNDAGVVSRVNDINPSILLDSSIIRYGVEIQKSMTNSTRKLEQKLKFVATENDFEKQLLEGSVIPPGKIGVLFDDIGSLEKVKAMMKEVVMLPIQRPELFTGLLKNPAKGILLFGPPGTGKTMLAKAVATEAGANFINISTSSIGSKWFGEGEKYAKAIFTLAAKISPTVIFIDEVDSILGRRNKRQHEGMRKITNEIMTCWDGLLSDNNSKVIVLAATNRPFDLDDAVLRRFTRRALVDLPDAGQRKYILEVLLRGESLDDEFDIDELASDTMTKGFSGSDLKELARAAAYYPIRDLLAKEKKELKLLEVVEGEAEAESTPSDDLKTITDEQKESSVVDFDLMSLLSSSSSSSSAGDGDDGGGVSDNLFLDTMKDGEIIVDLRKLKLSDFKKALKEVSASNSKDSQLFDSIRKWNDLYGEGGSRDKDSMFKSHMYT